MVPPTLDSPRTFCTAKPKKKFPKKEGQDEYSFQALRREKELYLQKAQAHEEKMLAYAKTLGFESIEEMDSALEEFRIQKELKDKGINPENEQAYKALVEEKKKLEQEKKAVNQTVQKQVEFVRQQRLYEIGTTVKNIAEEHGQDADEFLKKFSDKAVKEGFSVEDLIQFKNDKAIVYGLMFDELASSDMKKQTKKPSELVDTDKISKVKSESSTEKEEEIEKNLIEESLKDFKERMGL